MHEISIHFLLFRIWGAVPDGPSYSLQCTVLLINSFHSVPLIDMGGTHKGEAVKYFIFCKQKVIQQTFFFHLGPSSTRLLLVPYMEAVVGRAWTADLPRFAGVT